MRKMFTATMSAALSAVLVLSGGLCAWAADPPLPGAPGPEYRSETAVRDPNPVAHDNLGSQRAIRSDNVLSDSFRNGINDFSMKSAAAVLKEGQGNVNYSPVSLYYALALAAQGAQWETRDQLLTLLGAPDRDPAQLADGCGRLYRGMYKDDAYSRVKPVNSLWLQDGPAITDSYRRTAEGQYYTTVFRTDFAGGDTPGIIGNWASAQTGGALEPLSRTYPGEVMRSVGTVQFFSRWVYEFQSEENTRGAFKLPGGEQAECTYMNGRRNCSYYRGQGFLRATLTLSNNATMTFILPDQGVEIGTLLESEEAVKEMFGYVPESYGGVAWKIPKFRIGTSMDLRPMLEAQGISAAFLPERADFTGITGSGYCMSAVIQETVMGVEEGGAGIVPGEKVPGPEGLPLRELEAQMELDRPFLYAVLVEPGVPLFIGVCRNPGAQEVRP